MSGVIDLNQQLIAQIYSTDGSVSLAITGGGVSVLAELFGTAGASNTMLEAVVPYDAQALSRFVAATSPPDCSSSTARAMAMSAYQRARSLTDSQPVYGIGCTAAIATNRTRRGSDRCHVALQGAAVTATYDLTLDKSHTRPIQEQHCRDLILVAMARGFGISAPLPDNTVAQQTQAPTGWQQLLAGDIKSTARQNFAGIFPGAFNPIHQGHLGMLKIAKKRLGDSVALELSIGNVDKPPLDFATMEQRYRPDLNMVFTSAPTFLEKSALFPGATFIVGLDTITRVDDPRYYGSPEQRDQALTLIAERGNRFLVFGRLVNDHFLTLKDSKLTEQLSGLCDEVTEAEFRADISSSALRSEAAR